MSNGEQTRAGSARWGEAREALPSEGAAFIARAASGVPAGAGGRERPPLLDIKSEVARVSVAHDVVLALDREFGGGAAGGL